MDQFDSRSYRPMLLWHSTPFDSDEHIFELKLDGMRCLAYLDAHSTILTNRHGECITARYPELANLHRSVGDKCVLDGEIVCFEDGRPSIAKLLARNSLRDPRRIAEQSQSHSTHFVAFDILYRAGDECQTTLLSRKAILCDTVAPGKHISIHKYIPERGVDLFAAVNKAKLEGIVAKKISSTYAGGRRSADWLKIKAMAEEFLVICGFVPDEHGFPHDLVLAELSPTRELIHRGQIYAGTDHATLRQIARFATEYPAMPRWNIQNVVWMRPKLIAQVGYLQLTESGNMRHASFRGLHGV